MGKELVKIINGNTSKIVKNRRFWLSNNREVIASMTSNNSNNNSNGYNNNSNIDGLEPTLSFTSIKSEELLAIKNIYHQDNETNEVNVTDGNIYFANNDNDECSNVNYSNLYYFTNNSVFQSEY
jgi:hypothetical protein